MKDTDNKKQRLPTHIDGFLRLIKRYLFTNKVELLQFPVNLRPPYCWYHKCHMYSANYRQLGPNIHLSNIYTTSKTNYCWTEHSTIIIEVHIIVKHALHIICYK